MLKPKSFTPAYILNFLFLKSQETEFWMGQPGRTVGELSSYAIFPHFFFLQRGEFMKAFALESASGSFLLQTPTSGTSTSGRQTADHRGCGLGSTLLEHPADSVMWCFLRPQVLQGKVQRLEKKPQNMYFFPVPGLPWSACAWDYANMSSTCSSADGGEQFLPCS